MRRFVLPKLDSPATREQVEAAVRTIAEFLTVTQQQSVTGFWAQITGSSGPDQYTYTFQQVRLSGSGYGGWVTVTDGITGSAYNSFEESGTFSGAVPTDTVVWMHVVRTGPRDKQFWFTCFNENGV